jgi:catalase
MAERGEIGRYAYTLHAEDDDFGQAGTLVRDVLDDAERDRMVSNIVGHVSQDVSDDVQGRMIGYWTSVDVNLGARVAAGLGCGAGERAA